MMKTVFICSPYSGDVALNVKILHMWIRKAIDANYAPYAPHAYLPQVLDDNDALQRTQGISAGLAFLELCDEMWVIGDRVSSGMQREIIHAFEKCDLELKFYSVDDLPIPNLSKA